MVAFRSFLHVALWVFLFGPSSAVSESLPMIPPEDRLSLSAVGVIYSVGRDGSALCTGTLVARDLVITSAHCIKKNAGLLHNIKFVAGMNGTRHVANSGSIEVHQHPIWGKASGHRKFRYDVAVVRLSRPIAKGRVQPLRLFSGKGVRSEYSALLGYGGQEALSLHGRFDCTLSSMSSQGLYASDCPASKGNSGGAVLTKGDNGWELAGVIVAFKRRSKAAVVVELDDWLRGHVTDALQREEMMVARVQ